MLGRVVRGLAVLLLRRSEVRCGNLYGEGWVGRGRVARGLSLSRVFRFPLFSFLGIGRNLYDWRFLWGVGNVFLVLFFDCYESIGLNRVESWVAVASEGAFT